MYLATARTWRNQFAQISQDAADRRSPSMSHATPAEK
jgi:hypothetical protein